MVGGIRLQPSEGEILGFAESLAAAWTARPAPRFKRQSRNDIRDLMFTEIGWNILYCPMLTMLTWVRPAYFYIIVYVLQKTVIIPYTRVLVPPSLVPSPPRRPATRHFKATSTPLDTLQRGVQWIGGAVDRGSIT